jgi:hypothetical protein
MPSPSPTRSGTRKLSEVAKHLVVPGDITSTAWPAVLQTCQHKLGVEFDDWQDGAGRVILAKRADGTLAAMVDGVGLSLPRQVGKTYLIGALVFALCVNMPGLLVIWSAHHARTHGETFLALQGFAARAKVDPHVKQVFTGSGDEEIRFHNGSRILFGARERGFGRGIPGVDVLIFDEAQILSDKALSNMLATMNTSHFGLALYIGTPPKPDDQSEAFARMRRSALDGTLVDGAWIEFGADRNAQGDDHKQWRKANPSFPKRTPVQSLQRLKRKLTDPDWLREGLGIWDDTTAVQVIDPKAWAAIGLPDPDGDGIRSYAIDMSPDGSTVAVAVCARPDDGLPHIEVTKHQSAALGTEWAVEYLVERWPAAAAVVIDGQSPAMALLPELLERKVKVTVTNYAEMSRACGMFEIAVKGGAITRWDNPGQAALTTALGNAKKRAIGKAGGWGWDRKDPAVDLTPLVAVTLAHFGAMTSKRKPGRRAKVAVLS